MQMVEIEETFKKLGIINTEQNLTNYYPSINDIPESFQIRLDNVSKELSEDH